MVDCSGRWPQEFLLPSQWNVDAFSRCSQRPTALLCPQSGRHTTRWCARPAARPDPTEPPATSQPPSAEQRQAAQGPLSASSSKWFACSEDGEACRSATSSTHTEPPAAYCALWRSGRTSERDRSLRSSRRCPSSRCLDNQPDPADMRWCGSPARSPAPPARSAACLRPSPAKARRRASAVGREDQGRRRAVRPTRTRRRRSRRGRQAGDAGAGSHSILPVLVAAKAVASRAALGAIVRNHVAQRRVGGRAGRHGDVRLAHGARRRGGWCRGGWCARLRARAARRRRLGAWLLEWPAHGIRHGRRKAGGGR